MIQTLRICSALGRRFRRISNVGLVVDWRFHQQNRWVSIFAPYLVQAILRKFNPVVIASQQEYDLLKRKLKFIISMEPGWAAPRLKYDARLDQIKCVMVSDPHNKTGWFAEYVMENEVDFVLSQYKTPFFYHFPDFPPQKFVHFPWAVPDAFISENDLKVRSCDVAIFGGRNSTAYDVRNWCRQQAGVRDFNFSGVENKALSDEDYFRWLEGFDAAVAAGSSLAKFDLVTPKYFEIPASGALLFGQHCQDLAELGFGPDNAVIFRKEDFQDQLRAYQKEPELFLSIRDRGRELIRRRHKLSDRLSLLCNIMRRVSVPVDNFDQ